MHVVIDPPLATEWKARGLIQEAAQVILKGAPLDENHCAAIMRDITRLMETLEVHSPDWGLVCLECGSPDVRCTCDPQ